MFHVRLTLSGSPQADLDALAAFDVAIRRVSESVRVFGAEATLDARAHSLGKGPPQQVAERLAARLAHVGEVSIGLALSVWIAQLASGQPGITVVQTSEIDAFLHPLSTHNLPGASRLEAAGLRTLGDVADQSPDSLRALLGRRADSVWRLAMGHDSRRLVPDGRRVAVAMAGDDLPGLCGRLEAALEADRTVAGEVRLTVLRRDDHHTTSTRIRPAAASVASRLGATPRAAEALRLVACHLERAERHTQLALPWAP
ncbi:MAG: nucleotidyltransferase/DNA polymerase involved in DNA repair [Myxococcota bacterium]|jgi:nucleotidyltransferase/DNA polymerase involved in DNA repair